MNLKRKQLEKLTPLQSAIVLGGLLGDMHIQKNHESRDGNCRLRFSHSVEQREYILWKHKALLDPFCKNTQGVQLDVQQERRKDQRYSSYIFYTERRAEFNDIHDKWYIPRSSSFRKTVKAVPLDLDLALTGPLSLAVWYLDDGTKRVDAESCRIATQSFTRQGNEIIKACLLDNFKIDSKIEDWGRDKTGNTTYQIAILSSKRGGCYSKFRDLLYPIVEVNVPSMLYKLQKPRND